MTCLSIGHAEEQGPKLSSPSGGLALTNHASDASLNKTARLAGFLFLFTFVGPLFYGAFVFPKLTVAGNALATVSNILANELLFRLGIINELVCSVGAVVFAVVLYILLKTVNKSLALLALFLKLTEAVLLAVITLGHFIALLILKGEASLTVFGPGQLQTLAGSFINLYFHLGSFTMIFHGLNLMLFLYLLFKSKYVPVILPGFGVFSYALIFLYALIAILSPNYASMLTVQIICMAPSVLTELMIGSWLLIKGVKLPK